MLEKDPLSPIYLTKKVGVFMFQLLFALFIIVPIIEITVLMQVGELIGAWPTVIIVIISAWVGAKYVRQQGIATLKAVQSKMAQGAMPSSEIVSGLLLLVAGVLLVTPGFVTDGFGLLLLVPYVRKVLASAAEKYIKTKQGQGFCAQASFHSNAFTQETGHTYEHEAQSQTKSADQASTKKSITLEKNHSSSQTIEGDFQRKD